MRTLWVGIIFPVGHTMEPFFITEVLFDPQFLCVARGGAPENIYLISTVNQFGRMLEGYHPPSPSSPPPHFLAPLQCQADMLGICSPFSGFFSKGTLASLPLAWYFSKCRLTAGLVNNCSKGLDCSEMSCSLTPHCRHLAPGSQTGMGFILLSENSQPLQLLRA